MSYDPKMLRNPELRKYMDALLDAAEGHDHDGTNSKELGPPAGVANDSVTSAKIVDGAVIAAKIGTNAVITAKINDLAVTADKLASDSVITAKINDDAVVEAKIANDAVTTDKIADNAVTDDELAANAVTTVKINDGAVEADKLDSNAVTTAKVANGAITSDKLSAEFMQVAVEDLDSGDENAYAFAWENDKSADLIVHRVIVDVTTAGGTADAEIDVGVAANATTNSDNLIDGADINSTGLKDNIDDQGTNGTSCQKVEDGQYVTGQIVVANAASLAGKVYIYYTEIPS